MWSADDNIKDTTYADVVYDLRSALHYPRRLNTFDRDSQILYQQPDF
jgi:hypothetical protein